MRGYGPRALQGIFATLLLAFVVLVCALSLGQRATAQLWFEQEFPGLPNEATTPEQDEIVKMILTYRGPDPWEVKLQASLDLLDSGSVHPALERWAMFKKMKWLIATGHAADSIEVGRAWLKNHPADPGAFEIRYNIDYIIRQRAGSPGLAISFEGIKKAHDDLFDNHEPFHPDVLETRLQYVGMIRKFGSPDDGDILERRLEQLDLAEAATKVVVANPELLLRIRDRDIELEEYTMTRPLTVSPEEFKKIFLMKIIRYRDLKIPEIRTALTKRKRKRKLTPREEEMMRQDREERRIFMEKIAAGIPANQALKEAIKEAGSDN